MVWKVDKKRKKSIVEALRGRRVDKKVMAVQREKAERANRGTVIDPIAPFMFLVAVIKVVEEEEEEEGKEKERKERIQEIILGEVDVADKDAMMTRLITIEVVLGREEGDEGTGEVLINSMSQATKTSDHSYHS